MTRSFDTTPRVWIGCLQCYNEGNLVGDWHNATDADEITTSQLHGRAIDPGTHEELWCLDHENLPITAECSPRDAAELARTLEDVPERERPALSMPGSCPATTSKTGTGCRASATLKNVTAGNGHHFASTPSNSSKTAACWPTCPRR